MSLDFWNSRVVGAWEDEQPDEQYTLPIVVRVEKNANFSEENVFAALAEAMVAMFNDGSWDELLTLWCAGRIRKNVKKARGVKWEELLTVPHFIGRSGGAEVVILQPAPLDNIPQYFWKLQGQGIDFPVSGMSEVNSGFTYAFNPNVDMSSGKKLAQFGHALQIAIMTLPYSEVIEWVSGGMICNRVEWFEKSENTVEIVDAGFTEITPNTITVRAKIAN